MLKLNLACGHIQPKGWVNVDGSNRAWLASKLPWLDRSLVALKLIPPTEFDRNTVYLDMVKPSQPMESPWPWAPRTADAVYLGDVLEHFSPDDVRLILFRSWLVLKPGGVLRLRTPDHANFWRQYVEEYQEQLAAGREAWHNRHARWVKMYFDDICTVRPKLRQSMGHFHKWGWDEIQMTLLLEDVGFEGVGRRKLHESAIEDVAAVESRADLTLECVAKK